MHSTMHSLSHRMTSMTIRRLAALSLLVLAATACRDTAPLEPVDLATLVPAGGTQVVIQRETGPEVGTETFIVRVITRRADLASYQGEVTFAAGAFDLVRTITPAGADGEMYLVNPQVESGRIRFAALATEAFSTTEAFRFVVRPKTALDAMDVRASLSVAGIVAGAALEAAELRASDGVRDGAGRLIVR